MCTGYLGIQMRPLTPALQAKFPQVGDAGVLVTWVEPGKAAANAGIRPGDVILEVNQRKIEDDRHLRLQVAQIVPGTPTNLKFLRDGKTRTATAVLDELPARPVIVEEPSDN